MNTDSLVKAQAGDAPTAKGPAVNHDKQKRLSKALRDNLLRRKAATRGAESEDPQNP